MKSWKEDIWMLSCSALQNHVEFYFELRTLECAEVVELCYHLDGCGPQKIHFVHISFTKLVNLVNFYFRGNSFTMTAPFFGLHQFKTRLWLGLDSPHKVTQDY
eukprot:TRINITY_DN28026_c2_g1_i1.p1 TRINITY_DN28026_c2_g1~~TRINITY_DN28026_c2_g1_i1.p1  ORF type:complete len:103 (+),score=8.78 TRINITY_DN28026_c2_g1_i1:543-851(+)